MASAEPCLWEVSSRFDRQFVQKVVGLTATCSRFDRQFVQKVVGLTASSSTCSRFDRQFKIKMSLIALFLLMYYNNFKSLSFSFI